MIKLPQQEQLLDIAPLGSLQNTKVSVTDALVDVECSDWITYAREHGAESITTWEG